MSSTIRSVLTTSVPKARLNLTSANDLLANGNAGITELSSTSEILTRNLDLIQRQLDKWGAVMLGLNAVQRTAEEAVFEQYNPGGDTPGEMITILTETIGQLDLRVDQLRAQAQQQAAAVVPVQLPPIPPPQVYHIPLPVMGLLDFDGNPAKWACFWSNFRDNVDRRPELSPAQKLNYLMGQLKGPAKELVMGYPTIDTNYDIVKQSLVSRFGDEFKRANDLRGELLRLPKAIMTTASLRSFSEAVERICRQLGSLEANMDESPYVVTTILEKLPADARLELLKQERETGAKWSAKQWREGLTTMVQLREAAKIDRELPPQRQNGHHHAHGQGGRINGHNSFMNQPRRAFPVVEPTQKKGGNRNPSPIPNKPGSNCSLCSANDHKPTNCPKYPSAQKRQQRLTEQDRCHLCIRNGHCLANCSVKTKCAWCGGRHHLIVCQKYRGEFNSSSTKRGRTPTRANSRSGTPIPRSHFSSVATALVGQKRGRNPSYLMLRKVNVYNHRDPTRPVSVPLFWDGGSQTSFGTTELVKETNPRKVFTQEMVVGGFVGNQKETFSRFKSPCFSFLIEREDGGWEHVLLNQTDKITPPIDCLIEGNEFDEFSAENSEEPYPSAMEPKILIGIRDFWRFILGREEIRPGIFKIRTVFGTVYGGEEYQDPDPGQTSNFSLSCPVLNPAQASEMDIAKFWNLESIGISDCPRSNDDEIALKRFKETVKKDGEGRYEVGLPWKNDEEIPPENFRIAFSRLSALIRKFREAPQLFNGCNEILQDYLNRGIIEESTRTNAPQHFLPHHTVVGKRLRIVFDASSHERDSRSLNDTLFAGPNLYPDLAGKLIQFRATIYPVWADIEKAFLMISLKESDREFSKFLWTRDPNSPLSGNNLVIYRFRRITFGIVSCPFLLAATLQHHLETTSGTLAKEIQQHSLLYVDNLLLLAECPEEAREKAIEAQKIFSSAKMRLRDFVAADSRILSVVPSEDHLSETEPLVLGQKWILSSDTLFFSFPIVPSPEKLTRRIILKTIASFFDPLGLCSPCLVGAKLFFQSMWEKSRGWDEPIPDKEQIPWQELRNDWHGQTITIPRHTFRTKNSTLQLHVFSDASPNAFATSVYLRAETDRNFSSSLVYSRSRVKPRKMGKDQPDGLTIPRLELLGVLIGVRAAKFVKTHFPYEIAGIYLWSDSQIVLAWLSSTDKQPVFVSNRIREIRSHRDISFRYVRSADNPADLATRPIPPEELRMRKLWWKGPNWLSQIPENWPDEQTVILPPAESVAPEPIVCASIISPPIVFEFDRFGSWEKLIRTASFVVKFLSKLGKKRQLFPEIEGEEIFEYENQKFIKNWLFKIIQKGMNPPTQTYLDKNGVIRLNSRLSNIDDKDFAHPIVIPTNSPVLSLLIRHSHIMLKHAGVDATLTDFLCKFWCKKARRTVRKVITECNTCKKDRAVKFGLPPMPPLPKSRTHPSLAFENVGIDFLGPTLYKTVDSGPNKAWILLITCLACRAVHLELVNSLSADHFLLAFRRFVARRGLPKGILSDNGSQFVLSKNVLDKCTEFCIKWTLIPAFSPWSGGVYERLNALIKNCFRRILGRRILNWEEIVTFLTEVEASLNSRPITFVSDEIDGPIPLRPIDFLSPKVNLSFEEPEISEEIYRPSQAEKLAARWWATAKSIRQFWEKWSQEYLLMLRQRNQTSHKGPRSTAQTRPCLNQIVLVENEGFPRNTWPLGKIIELNEPKENPRSANILMPNGRIISRPVSKLVPLEEIPKEKENSLPPGGDFLTENGNDDVAENISLEKAKKATKPMLRWAKEPPRPQKRFVKWADKRPGSTTSASFLSSIITLTFVISLFFGPISAFPTLPKLMGNPTQSANVSNSFSCNTQGINVIGRDDIQRVEICCDGICGNREYKNPFLFAIPDENLLLGVSCLAQFWNGPNISTTVSAQCAPVDICLILDCYWCWERIFNFHCSPTVSAILTGLLLFLTGVALFFLCCFLKWTRCLLRTSKRCLFTVLCRWPKTIKKTKTRQLTTEDSDDEYEQWRKIHRNRRFKPLTKLGMALALICLSQAFTPGLGEPATITANTEECETNSNGTECSFNSVTLVNLLPVGQPVDLLIRGPESVLLGTMTFTLKGLFQECIPESLGFIRSYKIETLGNKRCPGMGSCTGKNCENLLTNQSVPELAEANNYPGNTYCIDSGSFWFNGCGGTNSACLYYRNYAVPTKHGNKFVYEIFRCPAWDFRIMLRVKINLHGNPSHFEETVLYSGHTFHLKMAKLSVTPAVFGSPAAPGLSGIFIGGRDKAALVPSFQPSLNCPDEISANLMQCSLSLNSCTKCRPDHSEGTVRCHCRETDVEKLLEDPTTKLPLSIGPFVLNYRHPKEIWAETDFVPIQIALKMEGIKLAISHQMATCKIIPAGITGCYRCRIGSRFSYTCTASYGTPLAEISCENGANWAIPCTNNPIQHNTSLSLNSAEINSICKVICPGGETMFVMKGTLSYLPSLGRNWRISGSRTNHHPGGFSFPEFGDFSHLFNWIFGGIQLAIIISVILFGILVFYCLIRLNPIFRGYRLFIRIMAICIIVQAIHGEEVESQSFIDQKYFEVKIFVWMHQEIIGQGFLAICIFITICAFSWMIMERRRRYPIRLRRDRVEPQRRPTIVMQWLTPDGRPALVMQ